MIAGALGLISLIPEEFSGLILGKIPFSLPEIKVTPFLGVAFIVAFFLDSEQFGVGIRPPEIDAGRPRFESGFAADGKRFVGES